MRVKEMINHLWGNHRNALVLLFALLLLNIVLLVVVQQYLSPRVLDKEDRFLKRQAEVRDILHNQSGATQSPEQQYVLGSQDLSRFHQAVPPYQEFTGLIEELLVLSGDSRLNIAQISYASENVKGSDLLRLNLNFNVLGNYDDVKKFIHSLEQSKRLLAIKQISLQGESGQAVNLRLSLDTYFSLGGQEL